MTKNINKSNETLVDMVCSNIRKDIIAQVLKPGEKINIKELAYRYGSSETPIKLALNRLLSEKLIENFPRKGMRIKSLNEDEAMEIFDFRLMMDLYYVDEITETVRSNLQIQKAFQENLDEHYQLMMESEDTADVDQYLKNYELDSNFHKLYLRCSGNKQLVELYQNINPFIYINHIFTKQSHKRNLEGVEEHKLIYQALVDGKADVVRQHITTHIKRAIHSIKMILKIDSMF